MIVVIMEVAAYQHESIDAHVVVDVLKDVPVSHPWVDNAKRKYLFRNSKEWQ